MKVTDVIFSLICGRVIGFLVGDFLKAWGVDIGFYYHIALWLALPFTSLFCLWIAYLIGKKIPFIFEMAKFVLVGAFATVVDLKLFESLVWLSIVVLPFTIVMAKAISFMVATFLKYWGNKYWAFQKHEKENIKKEVFQFFTITLGSMVIDVIAFYFFVKVVGPQFDIPSAVWLKFSVIFAGITAAFWNFLGYKHYVFKK